MARVHPSYKPAWETTEQGWHAVVSPCSNGYHWTAYLEYVATPQWRIWAGCLFQTVEQAKEWCHTEMAHQMKLNQAHTMSVPMGNNGNSPERQEHGHSAAGKQSEAWNWLWDTLNVEMGEGKTSAVRSELARRLQEERREQPQARAYGA